MLIDRGLIVRRFALIFLIVILGFPALEIYTMIAVADYTGWWLLAWLGLSALAGWFLIREESLAVFGRLTMAVQNSQSPFAAIWDSGRTILAGLLLIFPGVLSDLIALILLVLPNKTGRVNVRATPDDNTIEGEVRVVEIEKIESKSKSQ